MRLHLFHGLLLIAGCCCSALAAAQDIACDGDPGTPVIYASLGNALGTVVAFGELSTCGQGDHYADGSNLTVSCGLGAHSDDLAFLWDSPGAGLYSISTNGSDFDTVLQLRSEACPSIELGCNDDGFARSTSQLAIDSDGTERFTIVIDGFGLDSCGWFVLTITACADSDGDGILDCGRDGLIGNLDDDCDDGNPAIYPTAPEICDGLDNACRGSIPNEEIDRDGDGLKICAGDCDDLDASSFAGADELCDAIDNDCNGMLPDGEVDADGDGFLVCAGDCADNEAEINPDATEICDGLDNDCDLTLRIDEADTDDDGKADCLDADEEPTKGCAHLANPGAQLQGSSAALLVVVGFGAALVGRRRR